MQEAKCVKNGLRAGYTFCVAIALFLAVVLSSGVLSFTATAISPTADIDIELQPQYEYVKYTLDPLETDQRWDSAGAWGMIGTGYLADSNLVATANNGANLTLADWVHISHGSYYETKIKANVTTANAYMNLTGASAYVKIGLGAAGQITATFKNGTAHTTVNLAAYEADTWYMVAVYYENSVWRAQAFANNGTSLAVKTLNGASLAYANITQVIEKNVAAATTAYFDYMFQTSKRTAYVPTGTDSTGVNVAPTEDETFLHMKVDFSNPDQQPATYSNDPKVIAATGLSYFNVSVDQIKKVNLTDMANALTVLKEDKEPVVGVAKVKGWSNLQADSEAQLQAYLAGKHSVAASDISIVDYRITAVQANYTWSKSMEDKVADAWFKSIKNQADDVGAEVVFKDKAKTTSLDLMKGPEDVDYINLAGLTQKQYDSMMKGVSNDMRGKVLGLAMLSPDSTDNITQKSFMGSAGGMFSLTDMTGLSVGSSGIENVDSSYQFTDAALGQMLAKSGYLQVDVQQASDDGEWNAVKDGKLAAAPMTSVSLIGADLVDYAIIVLLVIIAGVAIGTLLLVKKRKVRSA